MYDGHSDYVLRHYGLERALKFHLASRVFPPHRGMFDAAEAAIWSAQGGDHDDLIDLPEGHAWNGQRQAPAHVIVDRLNLHTFVRGIQDALDDLDSEEDDDNGED